MRARLLLGLLVLSLAPAAARADHCGSQIFLFSYVSVPVADPTDPRRQLGNPTLASSAVGCLLIGSDDPTIPGDESDTDVIYPGSNTLVVRWLPGGEVDSGTLTFAGVTYELEFYTTTNGVIAVTDSEQIFVDPLDTIAGNTAEITVCADGECDHRVFRTVA